MQKYTSALLIIRANGHHLYGHDLDEDADDEEGHAATQYVRANGVARMGFHTNDTHSVESDSQVSLSVARVFKRF